MPAPLRIAVIGPTHPYSGGIATHTTTLANRLSAAGHRVAMISWKAQYPKFLRGGTTKVPDGEPEVEPVADARFPLAWYDPLSWLRVGVSLRRADVVVVTAVTPYHAVPYLVMRAVMGRRPARIVLAHNVQPHESGPLDRSLVRVLYRSFGRVLTHSESQQALAHEIAGDDVRVANVRLPLGDFLFAGGRSAASMQGGSTAHTGRRQSNALTVGFFGMVREYKGVDLLMRAASQVPGVRLVIAGEFWQPVAEYRDLVDELGIGDRVEIVEGYLKLADLPELLDRIDVLALPYRRGSATFNVSLGFLFGLPVLVTDAGTMALDVTDGVDGLVVAPDDLDALRKGLERLTEPGTLERLQAGVDSFQLDRQWADYVATLVALAADPA